MSFLITILIIGFIISFQSFKKRGNVSGFPQMDTMNKDSFDDYLSEENIDRGNMVVRETTENIDKVHAKKNENIAEKKHVFDLKKAVIYSAIMDRPY